MDTPKKVVTGPRAGIPRKIGLVIFKNEDGLLVKWVDSGKIYFYTHK